jgi:hypothetical protein
VKRTAYTTKKGVYLYSFIEQVKSKLKRLEITPYFYMKRNLILAVTLLVTPGIIYNFSKNQVAIGLNFVIRPIFGIIIGDMEHILQPLLR